ncbi:hypothetical protein TNCV_4156931 [Trichonephila clavipes]|nr:hypothetical protein TNCV_4156931 [Trichonephila clavipes]
MGLKKYLGELQLYIYVALRSCTRGLLVTDLVIFNHGQVTRTMPELASPFQTSTPASGPAPFHSGPVPVRGQGVAEHCPKALMPPRGSQQKGLENED